MIDERDFAGTDDLERWCDLLGSAGYRGTGTSAHERVIASVEDELGRLPGCVVRADPYELLGWEPAGGDLEAAGALAVDGSPIPVAGAVPYTLPEERSGELVPAGGDMAGKIVLIDFPRLPVPYDALFGSGLYTTPDCADLS